MKKSPDEIVLKRIFKCTKRQLFDAWSKPSVMAKWFFADSNRCQDSEIESDFRISGCYSLTMYFEDGDSSRMFGIYKDIVRYTTIVFTWNSARATDSLVTLSFKALSPNRTEMKLVHQLFPDEESRKLHNQGWELCLGNLAVFIAEMEQV